MADDTRKFYVMSYGEVGPLRRFTSYVGQWHPKTEPRDDKKNDYAVEYQRGDIWLSAKEAEGMRKLLSSRDEDGKDAAAALAIIERKIKEVPK